MKGLLAYLKDFLPNTGLCDSWRKKIITPSPESELTMTYGRTKESLLIE
jgi:hypothetical protein